MAMCRLEELMRQLAAAHQEMHQENSCLRAELQALRGEASVDKLSTAQLTTVTPEGPADRPDGLSSGSNSGGAAQLAPSAEPPAWPPAEQRADDAAEASPADKRPLAALADAPSIGSFSSCTLRDERFTSLQMGHVPRVTWRPQVAEVEPEVGAFVAVPVCQEACVPQEAEKPPALERDEPNGAGHAVLEEAAEYGCLYARRAPSKEHSSRAPSKERTSRTPSKEQTSRAHSKERESRTPSKELKLSRSNLEELIARTPSQASKASKPSSEPRTANGTVAEGCRSPPNERNKPHFGPLPSDMRSLKVRRSAFHSSSSFLLELSEMDVVRGRVHSIISTKEFDSVMGVVIVFNSFIIGLESTAKLNSDYDQLHICEVLEHIFLCVYILELGARYFAHGRKCFASGWVRFDAVLVAIGILGTWVITPIVNAVSDSSGVEGAMSPVMVLRIFRLFRLARALRLLVQFRTLWMLVQGLIGSSGTIFYTVMLIGMILYIFSCIGVEIIAIPWGDVESPFGDLVRSHWSSIPNCMLTLIRYVTLDSIGAQYEPMIKEHNYLLFFFIPFLLIVSVALMNLVTAVIVEGALEQAKRDKEAQNQYKKVQLQGLLPRLRELFTELDADGSGALSLDEVHEATDCVASELENCMGGNTLVELFEMIDEDDSGEVSIDEFCDGIAKMACSDSPIELFLILKQLAYIRGVVDTLTGAKTEDASEDKDKDVGQDTDKDTGQVAAA